MIITTTHNIAGKNIREYKGIVFGEVITGVNFFKDFGAGMRNIFGGEVLVMKKNLLKLEKKL